MHVAAWPQLHAEKRLTGTAVLLLLLLVAVLTLKPLVAVALLRLPLGRTLPTFRIAGLQLQGEGGGGRRRERRGERGGKVLNESRRVANKKDFFKQCAGLVCTHNGHASARAHSLR